MGRAPTSGNCHTCRQRRVKCDKARPVCQRCVKAGYHCQGYETVLRMQSHAVVAGEAPGSSKLARITNVSSFPAQEEPQASRQGAKGDSRNPRGAGRALYQGSKRRAEAAASHAASPGRTSSSGAHDESSAGSDAMTPPQELSLAGFVDDISFSYFFHSYGWINMHSILLQDAALRGSLSDEGLAYDSLRALSYGLMGRDHHIQSLQETSQRLYGGALKRLRSRLVTASKEELATVVKPIAILGSYSVGLLMLGSRSSHAN